MEVPALELGLFTIISKIPSGTLVNVADHEKAEGGAPTTPVITGFVTGLHATEFASNVGGPPIPEEDMLNEMLFVTLVHNMVVSNSRTMLIVVEFGSPGNAVMRASWPGRNRVSIGRGGTHSVVGTRTFIP